MNIEFVLSAVGLAITIASIAYAVYEGRSRARLTDYIRSQTWHLYSKANNANGTLQLALQHYKQRQDPVDPEVLESLARADAHGQDVLKDIIRQIQSAEATFDHDSISAWVAEGRVSEPHSKLFRAIAPANKRIQSTGRGAAGD